MRSFTILLANCGSSVLAAALADTLTTGGGGSWRLVRLTLPAVRDRWGETLGGEMQRERPEVVVVCGAVGEGAAIEGLLQLCRKPEHPAALVLAMDAMDPGEIVRWLNLGVDDYFAAPFRAVDLVPRLVRLWGEYAGADPVVTRVKEKLGLLQVKGEDPDFIATIRRIPAAAGCEATVLIRGESGTGKEVCAQAIHHLSRRSGRAFVPVNCGAIPADLVENELFGHVRGAFTDAGGASDGLVRQCEGGTLFLDEVDSLPPSAQVKLLRFLQEREYRPLGATRSCRADVRIVAASNQHLERAMQAGRLRPDLYYRLSVIVLELPPLRDRRSDIPILARHFVAKCSTEMRVASKELSRGAIHKLLLHDWPGNVRELENVVQRAMVFSEGDRLRPEDIEIAVGSVVEEEDSFKVLKAKAVAGFERAYLLQQLQDHGGNITRAARAARKNRRAFWELMRKHELSLGDWQLTTEASDQGNDRRGGAVRSCRGGSRPAP